MKKLPGEFRSAFQRHQRRRTRREESRKLKRFAKRLQRGFLLAERRRFADQHQVLLDRNLAREQIVLPAVFSCWENYEATIAVIRLMRQAGLMERHQLMVHFENVQKIDPAAALVLVAEIFRIRNLRGQTAVHGTYPMRRDIYDLLSDMGFFQLLNITEAFGRPAPATDPSRPVFLRFVSSNRVDAEGVDHFVSVVETHLFPLSPVSRGKLVGAIKEAMSNTLDHAHPAAARQEGYTMPNRWWMSSWVNLAEREVTIMLFDQGVGIPATLTADRYHRVRAALTNAVQFRSLSATPHDGQMILAATELYRSGTGVAGRGRGFRDMKLFVDTCDDGELRVLSNRGRYSYIPGTESCSSESLSLGGTVIEWRFRHEGPVDVKDD